MFQHQESPPPRKERVLLDKSRKKIKFLCFFPRGKKPKGGLSLSSSQIIFPCAAVMGLHAGLNPVMRPIRPMGRGGVSAHLFSSALPALLGFIAMSLPVFIAHFSNYISGPTSAINALLTLIFPERKVSF